MKLYLQIYFSASGADALDVLESIKKIGFEPVIGEYDHVLEYENPEEYRKKVEELKRALRGTETRYRLITRKE